MAAAATTAGKDPVYHHIWQDREIRFDSSTEALKIRRGERVIDTINAVEDTKGNNGDRGALSITNLRVIWCSHKNPSTNLSIGLDCITGLSIRTVSSKLKGQTQALCVTTKYNSSRFEFIFTSLVKNSPRLFTTIQTVNRSYETSRLYRDLKLRCAIVKDNQLQLLPDETVYSKVPDVWNLSSDQGNLGTFYVTNVRVVWFASLAENFNVSIPYVQIRTIKVRDSKFGNALVIETSALSGSFVLGFRLDDQTKLMELVKEVRTLQDIFHNNPVFGVKFELEERPTSEEQSPTPKNEQIVEDVKVVSADDNTHFDALSAYYADAGSNTDREPVYSPELGLAVEKLRDGLSLDELWQVTAT